MNSYNCVECSSYASGQGIVDDVYETRKLNEYFPDLPRIVGYSPVVSPVILNFVTEFSTKWGPPKTHSAYAAWQRDLAAFLDIAVSAERERLTDGLGPLPAPAVRWTQDLPLVGGGAVMAATYYREDQMLAYAAQERAAERERCAKIVEAEDVAPTDDAVGVQQCIAASIRRA